MTVRLPTGTPVLDNLLGGGIVRGLSIVLQGPAGEEKETVAWEFLKRGLEEGEGALVVLSSMSPDKFRERMAELGVDISTLEGEGRVIIVDWYSYLKESVSDIEDEGSVLKVSVDLTNVGIAVTWALTRLPESAGVRAVLDIVSPALNAYDLQEVFSFAQVTKAKLEKRGATSLFLIQKEVHDTATLSNIQQPFDGVIDIERVREGDEILRKIGVPSMRGSPPSSKYVPLAEAEVAPKKAAPQPPPQPEETPPPASDVTGGLHAAVKKDPKDPEGWMALAWSELLSGNAGKALKYLDAVTRLNPDHQDAWRAKAKAYDQLGLDEQADDARQKAGMQKPSKSKAGGTRTCPSCGTELSTRDDFCYGCGADLPKVDDARFSALMSTVNKRLDRDEEDLDALFVKGAAMAKLERWAEAAELLNLVTKHDPAYPGVWILKAKVYARLGKPKMAKACRERALTMMGQERVDTTGPRARLAQREAPEPKRPTPEPPKPDPERGLVNGLRRERLAPPKGRVNGLTNGARGRTNGLVNGRGRTNGLVNGMGRTNGLVNGRGRTNGLVNGRGRTNGVVNGLTSARVGLEDGLTNGSGFTNGLAGHRYQRDSRRQGWKLYLVPALAVLLLLTPLISPATFEVTGVIRIDGNFSDWDEVRRTVVQSNMALNPNIDILEVSVEDKGNYLSFYVEVSGTILQGNPTTQKSDAIHIFIDLDRTPDTGYRVMGTGADYALEVYGAGGLASKARLLQFDANADRDDWNGWLQEGTVLAQAVEAALETQVYWPTMLSDPVDVDVVVHAKSWDGSEDFADYVLGTTEGLLLVQQMSAVPTQTLSGVNQPLLELEFTATHGTVEVLGLDVEVSGTATPADISAVKLVDATGTVVSQRILIGDTVSFDASFTVAPGAPLRYLVVGDLAATGSGATVGASLRHNGDLRLGNGTATLRTLPGTYERGYVELVPPDVVIDGGFADWMGGALDSDDEAEVSGHQRIDLNRYHASNDNASASFYLRVDGEILAGAAVPSYTPTVPSGGGPVVVDSDRDSVPDSQDGPNGDGTRPFDFNNDGTTDLQSGSDFDGDGILDYPTGPDLWRNTTIPANYPAPYANRSVSLYIGPKTLPVNRGEDVARIFIDVDEIPGTGYAIGSGYADYMIEVEGKHGEVYRSQLYEHVGAAPGQWMWASTGDTPAMTDYSQLEVQVPLATLGLGPGDGFGAFFHTVAWRQTGEDVSDAMLTNVTTRGSPGTGTRHYADSNGGYGLVAPDGGTIDITIDGVIDEASETDWTSTAKTDTYGSNLRVYVVYNATELFVAVEVLAQGTGSGTNSDYAEITFDTSHDDGTAPQTDDYKFSLSKPTGNPTLSDDQGTGSGWNQAFTTDEWGGDADDTDTYVTYEFNISLTYVFGTSTPSEGDIAGFSVHVYNSTGNVYYYWPDANGAGQTNGREDSPDEWGDLFYKKPRLVINEVSPLTSTDWVELYNGGDSIDINGIVLSDQDGFTWKRGSSLVVPNGVYLVLKDGSGTDDTDFSDGKGTIYIGTTEFSTTGEDVLLKFGGNDMGLDCVEYGTGGDVQSCPTDPASENSWSGTLDAPTGSDSVGRDKSSSDTNSASDWDNTSGPDVDQTTEAHVNYLASLTVIGTDQAPASVVQGEQTVVMLNLTLTADYGWIEITALDVNRTGTSSTEADVSAATLWDDVNGNGQYDSGTDTFLASGSYSGGYYDFTGLSIFAQSGNPEYLLILYNISSSANTGVTVGARIDGEANVTVSSPDSVASLSAVQSTNSTIQGNQLTVAGTDQAPATIYQGQTEVVMLNLTLSTSWGSLTVTEIDVNRTGNSTAETDLSEVTLWDDVNDNGIFDSGTDTFLAVGTYSNGNYTFSSLSISVTAGTDEGILVMYNVSATANTDVTVGARIDGAANVTVTSPDSVASFSPIQSTNSTIQGDVLSVSGVDRAPSSVAAGTNNVVMLWVNFSANYGSLTVTQIEVNRTGTSTSAGDIAAANLYLDDNNDGDYDPGVDDLIAVGSYSNGVYTFSSLNEVIDTGADRGYLIMYNISESANTGVTVGARIDGATNITVASPDSVASFTALQSTNTTINAVVLTVAGTDNAPATVEQGQTEVLMLNLTLSANAGVATVTGIDVNRTGTSSAEGDISAATLWDDANDNGVFDSGTDTFLAAGTYSDGYYAFSGLSFDVASGTPERLLILYNMSATSNTGVTVGARIDGEDNITLSGSATVSSFSPIQSTNTTINGNELSVYGGDAAFSVVFQGEKFAEMLNLTLSASLSSVTVTQIEVTKTGTSSQASDIDAAVLYDDVNGDGDYDAGTDTYLATATYSAGVYTFSSLSITVNSGTDETLLIMYNISASATLDVTVGAKIDGASDITVTSPDTVASFSAISSTNALIRSSDVFVIETSGEVYESTDGGKSFTYQGDASSAFVAIVANRSNTDLYAFVDNGSVYLSTDSGQSWTWRGDGYSGASNGEDITIDANDDIYIVRVTGLVYKSTDGGANFVSQGDAGNNLVGLEANYSNNDLYAVDTTGTVYYSSDSGQTWQTRGDAGAAADYEDIAIDSNGYVYVLKATGEVFRSTDYGNTFSQLSDIGSENYVGITIDTNYDYLYVIADTGEVYLSVDQGGNWTLRSDIGSQTDYADIAVFIIPEFSEVALALLPFALAALFGVLRRRRRRTLSPP